MRERLGQETYKFIRENFHRSIKIWAAFVHSKVQGRSDYARLVNRFSAHESSTGH